MPGYVASPLCDNITDEKDNTLKSTAITIPKENSLQTQLKTVEKGVPHLFWLTFFQILTVMSSVVHMFLGLVALNAAITAVCDYMMETPVQPYINGVLVAFGLTVGLHGCLIRYSGLRGVFERNVRFLHRSTIGLMCLLAMMGLIYIIRLIAFDGKYFAWNEDKNIWEGCVCDTSVSGQEVGLPLTPRDLLFGFIPLRLERLLYYSVHLSLNGITFTGMTLNLQEEEYFEEARGRNERQKHIL